MWQSTLKTALGASWRLESEYIAMRQTVRLAELVSEYSGTAKALADECFKKGASLQDLVHEASQYKGLLAGALQEYLLEMQSQAP